MVAADAETDLAVHLEAATGGEEAEGWRAEGVGRRKDDSAMVYPRGVYGRGRSAECEVPGEEVCFCGKGVEVRGGSRGEFCGFADCRLNTVRNIKLRYHHSKVLQL